MTKNIKIETYSREGLIKRSKTLFDKYYADYILISFYDPGLFPIKLPFRIEKAIYISLYDISPDVMQKYPNILDKYNINMDTLFVEESKRIAEFVNSLADNSLIICQCEYGISRSVGCAAAISEYFYGDGRKYFDDPRYLPNKLIYKMLLKQLKNTIK